jgi:exodeoxyribonuclease VII small subunit
MLKIPEMPLALWIQLQPICFPSSPFNPMKRTSKASQSTSIKPDANWSYETAVAEVESVIDQIESGELELAAVFDQFAIAVEQLKQCETFLSAHRQQVDLMIETLSDLADDDDF